jgi:DNA-binding LytR/AlgR family response regulator
MTNLTPLLKTPNKLGLNQPYPFETNRGKQYKDAVVFSTFVFLFLYIFQPFEIGNFKTHTISVSFGYGLVCLITMLFLNIVLIQWIPKYFNEKNWTTGRQIFWTFVNVFLIGLGNFLFSTALQVVPYSLEGVVKFQFFTIAVGAFPIVISVLYNQSRLQNRYSRKSEEFNDVISKSNEVNINLEPIEDQMKIVIPSQYAQENLELFAVDLLFIRTADNYIEVHFKKEDVVQKCLLRNTLKAVESILRDASLFRCHKSYLVNLNHVNHVSGNAQGYKLHLKFTNEVIPVSRSNNDFLKSHFDKGH